MQKVLEDFKSAAIEALLGLALLVVAILVGFVVGFVTTAIPALNFLAAFIAAIFGVCSFAAMFGGQLEDDQGSTIFGIASLGGSAGYFLGLYVLQTYLPTWSAWYYMT